MAVELLKNPIAEPASSTSAMAPGVAAKPEAEESAVSGAAASEPKSETKVVMDDPLKSLCWALLSSNEFLFLN
jgi:hypothetical protein